jgi:hypothetical protein
MGDAERPRQPKVFSPVRRGRTPPAGFSTIGGTAPLQPKDGLNGPSTGVQISRKSVPLQQCRAPRHYGVTVKVVELAAVPPGVVTWILPVLAPVGTVAVI